MLYANLLLNVLYHIEIEMKIRESCLQTGNFIYKPGISLTKQDFHLQRGSLGLQRGFSGYYLPSYIFEVRESTEKILERFSYDELKWKIPDERKGYLKSLNVVNCDEKAIWLIDYWCSKDIRGLIQMPFSRHWIMHTEACLRIKNKMHS